MKPDFDVSAYWIDFLILGILVYSTVRLLFSRRRKKRWETVEGYITYSTVGKFTYDTEDDIVYQFTYDGILYEIRETFVYDKRPYGKSTVTVYINPRDIFKSTIKPPQNDWEYLINAVVSFFIFLGLLLYKIYWKKG